MGGLNRTIVITTVSLRTLRQRAGASAVAVVGVACVVLVFVAVLSIAEGFQAALAGAGSPDTTIIMRGGSDSELGSALTLADTRIIKDAAGVRRADSGPVASAELFVVVDLLKRSTRTVANVPLRGVEPAAFGVRTRCAWSRDACSARAPTRSSSAAWPPRSSWGSSSAPSSAGAREWEVVGIFEADGTVSESEIWCDARVLQPAYRRGDSFQSVLARLDSADVFDRFRATLSADPRLDVMVEREDAYYQERSELVHALITGLGTIIAVLMGIGAVFGAVNTMYNAVAARTREIATLRAIGFSSFSVVVSVLTESALLSVIGGVLGGSIAYGAFHGYQTATYNWQTFSQVVFSLDVTPALLVQGGLYALVMGLLGGLFPAVRAARVPIVAALRQP